MEQDSSIRFGNFNYLLIILFVGCVSINSSDLTLKDKLDKKQLSNISLGLYVSEKIPLNGFYLYDDGSCYHQIERYYSTKNDLIISLNDPNKFKKDFNWGVYTVEKDEIKIQQFVGTDGNGLLYKFEVFTYVGKILNNSSIVIHSRYDKDNNFMDMNNRVFNISNDQKLPNRK